MSKEAFGNNGRKALSGTCILLSEQKQKTGHKSLANQVCDAEQINFSLIPSKIDQ
jgi:hypothetical protein